MKVRMWVQTNMRGSKIETVMEFEDGDFDHEYFETWVWDNIDAGFEVLP